MVYAYELQNWMNGAKITHHDMMYREYAYFRRKTSQWLLIKQSLGQRPVIISELPEALIHKFFSDKKWYIMVLE